MGPDDIEARRRALQQSFAPRVERTRASINAAVRTLACDGQELSVAAIGRVAGISRATFYAHYSGLDGLARAVWQDACVAVDDLFRFDLHTTPDAVPLVLGRLVEHVADHRSLYAAVAALPVSKASYLANVRAFADVIEQALDDAPHDPPGLHAATTARYMASAIYGLLDAWVAGELDLTEAELVEHLAVLHPFWNDATGRLPSTTCSDTRRLTP